MKKGWLVILIISVLSCSVKEHTIRISETGSPADSVEYKLIVVEPGYDGWATTNRKPIWFYSYSYYRNHNILYVNEWNYRVRNTGYKVPYDNLIEYNQNIDYGIELEYNLFWYFKFIQQKYNIKLLTTERPI